MSIGSSIGLFVMIGSPNPYAIWLSPSLGMSGIFFRVTQTGTVEISGRDNVVAGLQEATNMRQSSTYHKPR